ncbi:hypothetical protein SBOR_9724 [Sclerotinia borealis F-4128]|uniref:Mitochondrial genome maintenance protein Mgr2 n=1 Tax=Sclerotinia borealis (strain F-4128) TaxID=1432307 RepID=W9C2H2_SCLBF|nr:hypothetical protein SBOR_9724 [Sclerotinia borealis F-4128]
MPPVPQSQGHPGGQTVWNKLQMGAMMGGTVGTILGFMYGTLTIIKFGPGPNGVWRTLRTYMLTSGSTFGFFMAIGSTIRSDSIASPETMAAFGRANRRPLIMNRPYRSSRTS